MQTNYDLIRYQIILKNQNQKKKKIKKKTKHLISYQM